MDLKSSLIYFLTGGVVTLIIVGLEESGLRTWSGIATLMPIFTLVSYIFIGNKGGGVAVAEHAKFVLFGTLISWVPYMLAVILLSSRLGAHKAIVIGLTIFFVCAAAFVLVAEHYHLFQ